MPSGAKKRRAAKKKKEAEANSNLDHATKSEEGVIASSNVTDQGGCSVVINVSSEGEASTSVLEKNTYSASPVESPLKESKSDSFEKVVGHIDSTVAHGQLLKENEDSALLGKGVNVENVVVGKKNDVPHEEVVYETNCIMDRQSTMRSGDSGSQVEDANSDNLTDDAGIYEAVVDDINFVSQQAPAEVGDVHCGSINDILLQIEHESFLLQSEKVYDDDRAKAEDVSKELANVLSNNDHVLRKTEQLRHVTKKVNEMLQATDKLRVDLQEVLEDLDNIKLTDVN